jgi:hypothetical protein
VIDTVSALFVMRDGPYPRLVADWWDEARDARLYPGPNPGVYHPPCARWGRFWWSDGSEVPGADEGCFASAIESLRRWGGVLEHPEGSFAWERHGIRRPEPGCWSSTILRPDEWVATVDQRCWGHRARKRTWLVAVGCRELPEARRSTGRQAAYLCTPRLGRKVYVSSGPGPSRTRALREAHGIELMGRREAALTPPAFAELLVSMAASVTARAA